MKKEEFLTILLARLIERGVPEDSAKKETEHVRTYLSESGMEELDISVDEMADGIISMLNDTSDSEKPKADAIIPISSSSDSEGESVSDELEAAIAAFEADTELQDNNTEEPEVSEEPVKSEEELSEGEVLPLTEIPIFIETEEEVDESGINTEDSSDEVIEESVLIQPEGENYPAPEPEVNEAPVSEIPDEIAEIDPQADTQTEEQQLQPEQTDQPASAPIFAEDEVAEIEEFIPYDKKKKMKNKDSVKKTGNEWLYVALLVITIPIVIALVLIAMVLYLGFWIVLALAMIACIAVLIVFVTVGAIVSLVGIVYGVVQLITGQIPVGLFEVGLGVIVGSAVMFVGILVYNFAVRFIPFGMRLLAKLFGAGFRAIRSGYQSLKGAVESI